jgi:hypothetical protein
MGHIMYKPGDVVVESGEKSPWGVPGDFASYMRACDGFGTRVYYDTPGLIVRIVDSREMISDGRPMKCYHVLFGEETVEMLTRHVDTYFTRL